jgi:hypothetical protein
MADGELRKRSAFVRYVVACPGSTGEKSLRVGATEEGAIAVTGSQEKKREEQNTTFSFFLLASSASFCEEV